MGCFLTCLFCPLQFKEARSCLLQAVAAASADGEGNFFSVWLSHTTSIWMAWARTERDQVTHQLRKVKAKLGKVQSAQEKTEISIRVRQPKSKLSQAIAAANKRFEHNTSLTTPPEDCAVSQTFLGTCGIVVANCCQFRFICQLWATPDSHTARWPFTGSTVAHVGSLHCFVLLETFSAIVRWVKITNLETREGNVFSKEIAPRNKAVATAHCMCGTHSFYRMPSVAAHDLTYGDEDLARCSNRNSS